LASNNLNEDVGGYLHALREGSTPFERFVARRDIKDMVDVPTPRKQIDDALLEFIDDTARDHACRLIPALGSVGSGKTHSYWAYKDMEMKAREKGLPQWSIIYVPCPLPEMHMIHHMYTCIMDELGRDILQICAQNVVNRWAGKKDKAKKKYIDEIILKGLQEYPGSYADIVKVLAIYVLDKNLAQLAERWLFGETLSDKNLAALDVNFVLEEDDMCLAMIKILTAHSGRVFVFFFDDFFENVGGNKNPKMEARFMGVLRTLYGELKNSVLILTDNQENWPNTLALADSNLQSFMASPLEIQPFTVEDVKEYFAKSMQRYWRGNNLPPPPDPLFPLNDTVLEILFDKTKGNPRNTVKLARVFVDKVVTGEVTLEDLATEQIPIQLTPEEQEASKRGGSIKGAVSASKLPASEAIEKLRKIIRVSDRVPIPQLAQVLRVDVTSLWDHVFEWAERFRFRVDNDILVLKDGDIKAFLLELGKLVR